MTQYIKKIIDNLINKDTLKKDNNYKIPDMHKQQIINISENKIESIDIKPKEKINVEVNIQNEIEIPKDLTHSVMANYTDYNDHYNRWLKNTSQYYLAQEWNTNGRKSSRGIATLDNRYLVAVTSKFGNVGDNIDVVLDDNTLIECKIADIKDPTEDNVNEYGHLLKTPKGNDIVDVIEWEIVVPKEELEIADWINKRVIKIKRYKE